jgi:hypothetical protein
MHSSNRIVLDQSGFYTDRGFIFTEEKRKETHQLTNSPTHQLASLPAHQLTSSPTHQLTNLL